MAVDDVYQVDCHFTFQDNPNVFIYHVREDGAGGGNQEDDLNEYFKDVVLPTQAIFQMDTLEYVCIETKRILQALKKDPISSLPRQLTVSLTGMKTSPQEALPGQCSLVVQLLNDPDNLDPKRRGRDFWTGFAEEDQNDGTWLQATADAVTGAMNAVFTQPFIVTGGESFLWGIYSQTLAAQRKAQDPATPAEDWIDPFSLIQEMRPLQQMRTQRRRQPDNPCKLYYPSVPSG